MGSERSIPLASLVVFLGWFDLRSRVARSRILCFAEVELVAQTVSFLARAMPTLSTSLLFAESLATLPERSTGQRVCHQKVLNSAIENNSEEPGVVVQNDEIVKGCEYSKGQYISCQAS
jgi:hypothetical protein